jgi:hypothetical protein
MRCCVPSPNYWVEVVEVEHSAVAPQKGVRSVRCFKRITNHCPRNEFLLRQRRGLYGALIILKRLVN